MTEPSPDSWWPADERFMREHVAKRRPAPPHLTKPPAITEDELLAGYRSMTLDDRIKLLRGK
jgi:hypothetical protein